MCIEMNKMLPHEQFESRIDRQISLQYISVQSDIFQFCLKNIIFVKRSRKIVFWFVRDHVYEVNVFPSVLCSRVVGMNENVLMSLILLFVLLLLLLILLLLVFISKGHF